MTENKHASASGWPDPDEAPEWTDEMFDRAEFAVGERVVRKARPPAISGTLVEHKHSVPHSIAGVKAMAASKTTGNKAAKAASKTLKDGRTAEASKTATGSALSQVEKKKKS